MFAEAEVLDAAEDADAGVVDVVAGAGADEAGVVDADELEFDADAELAAGAELGADMTAGVAAEVLEAAAASDEEPDDPPPHDAHSSAATTITTARMGSFLPNPARCSRLNSRAVPCCCHQGLASAVPAAQPPLQCGKASLMPELAERAALTLTGAGRQTPRTLEQSGGLQ